MYTILVLVCTRRNLFLLPFLHIVATSNPLTDVSKLPAGFQIWKSLLNYKEYGFI